MKTSIFAALAAVALVAPAEESITGVTARQRWPWNGVVDIDFTLVGAAAENYKIEVEAQRSTGGTKYYASSYLTDPVVRAGQNRISWDFGKDNPNVKADDMRFTVSAVPLAEADKPTYMVIDLSGGANADAWPVRYTSQGPNHVQGASGEPCQTTEMWLKRVHPASQTFTPLSWRTPSNSNSNFYQRLTKDYYLAIFETTQQQWYQMTGKWPSRYSNELYRTSRPMDRFCTQLFFGKNGYNWPDTQTPLAGSLWEKCRTKTGLSTFNLPSEAQWMFVNTSGPTNGRQVYVPKHPDGTSYTDDEYCRYSGNNGGTTKNDDLCGVEKGTAYVGSYIPSPWGFYDLMGNVSEDCLDPFVSTDDTYVYLVEQGTSFPVDDFSGIPNAKAQEYHGSRRVVSKGFSFSHSAAYMVYWQRGANYISYPYDGDNVNGRGVRFCVTVE